MRASKAQIELQIMAMLTNNNKSSFVLWAQFENSKLFTTNFMIRLLLLFIVWPFKDFLFNQQYKIIEPTMFHLEFHPQQISRSASFIYFLVWPFLETGNER